MGNVKCTFRGTFRPGTWLLCYKWTKSKTRLLGAWNLSWRYISPINYNNWLENIWWLSWLFWMAALFERNITVASFWATLGRILGSFAANIWSLFWATATVVIVASGSTHPFQSQVSKNFAFHGFAFWQKPSFLLDLLPPGDSNESLNLKCYHRAL